MRSRLHSMVLLLTGALGGTVLLGQSRASTPSSAVTPKIYSVKCDRTLRNGMGALTNFATARFDTSKVSAINVLVCFSQPSPFMLDVVDSFLTLPGNAPILRQGEVVACVPGVNQYSPGVAPVGAYSISATGVTVSCGDPTALPVVGRVTVTAFY